MIYLHNKNKPDELSFLIAAKLTSSQRGYIINVIDYIYSKMPPDDEQLIYSKHVEDDYYSKLRKKVHMVGSYYAN